MYKFSEAKKKFWPVLSSNLIYAFIVLSISIIGQLETDWDIYRFILLTSIFLSSLKNFLNQIFWEFWQELPGFTHKWISIISSFWIYQLVTKCFFPITKENFLEKHNK